MQSSSATSIELRRSPTCIPVFLLSARPAGKAALASAGGSPPSPIPIPPLPSPSSPLPSPSFPPPPFPPPHHTQQVLYKHKYIERHKYNIVQTGDTNKQFNTGDTNTTITIQIQYGHKYIIAGYTFITFWVYPVPLSLLPPSNFGFFQGL